MPSKEKDLNLQRKFGFKESRDEFKAREQFERQNKWEKRLSKESFEKLESEMHSLSKAKFLSPQQKERKRLVQQLLFKMEQSKLEEHCRNDNHEGDVKSLLFKGNHSTPTSAERIAQAENTSKEELFSESSNVDEYSDLFGLKNRLSTYNGTSHDTSIQNFIPRAIQNNNQIHKYESSSNDVKEKVAKAELDLLQSVESGTCSHDDIDELFEELDSDSENVNGNKILSVLKE